MMLADFDYFREELKQLCAVLGKSYTDAIGQGYWRALKHVELAEIKANVDKILRAASKETKFPRPVDLQNNAPTIVPTGSDDKALELAIERCKRNWEERLRLDPEMTRIELAVAKTDLILAQQHESSVIYATALDENRRYRAHLQALRNQRRQVAST